MKLEAAIALAAVLLLPAASKAYRPSPQYGAFELKFGPYTPNVDDEPSLGSATPYATTLENDTMFLTLLELDWQFLRLPGVSFGLGGSTGFMQAYAPARSVDGIKSADYTVLNVIPFSVLGVLRVDVLVNELGVPLAPFGKIGLDWYLWWVLEGSGDTAWSGGEKASGGTLGWHFSTGLMFCLDPLDRTSARTFDNEIGVNHSYLFFEYFWGQIEGFGRDGYLYLSPTNLGTNGTFMIGLALEF